MLKSINLIMPQLDNYISLAILGAVIFSSLGLGLIGYKYLLFSKDIPTTTLLFKMKKQEVEFLLSSLLTEYKEQHPYDDIPSITSINIPKVVKSFFFYC